MKAARLHEYGKPLVLEDIPVPDIQPDEILVNVQACGMCRSDVQLVDGYFRKYADIPTPITLGHEITGIAHKIGGVVPKVAGFQEGDHVVVAPGWGDGVCRQYAHLSQRALARIRTGGRFCRVHPRPGSLSGQGVPSSEIRGTRAAHRCGYDTLPWHEKTSRCWRARPGSGDRGFGYRWTRRVCRSVRPTARRWCEGRRFRPQSRQARYREELWSRSRHQHQGQVLKRYCQGTQQRHGPG